VTCHVWSPPTFDGTLLTSEHTVSARTRQALDAVREAGVEVLFVTARAPRSVHEIAAQAGHERYAVCCNGAVRYVTGQLFIREVRAARDGARPTWSAHR
jgi:HAD superfamily hydrolase (TIGR01484 family)